MTTAQAIEHFLKVLKDEKQEFGPSQVLIEEVYYADDDTQETTSGEVSFKIVLCKLGPAWFHLICVADELQESKGVVSMMTTLEQSVLDELVYTNTIVVDQTRQSLATYLKQYLPKKDFRELDRQISIKQDDAIDIIHKEDRHRAGGHYIREGIEAYLFDAYENKYQIVVLDNNKKEVGKLAVYPDTKGFYIDRYR